MRAVLLTVILILSGSGVTGQSLNEVKGPEITIGPTPPPHPEAPAELNLAAAVEEATDIFYLTIADYYGAHYVRADVNSILMGSYVNTVWCDRRIGEGDPYPFTPGEEYILFLFETMGDTYRLIYNSAEWAIHPVDGDGYLDLSVFDDVVPAMTVDNLRELIAELADPFYLKEGG
ncbi:MAG: hypothetical protein GY771_16735 [bacterium]|nr:hypothetical protein [bacterium]